jgi:hypothetical protein
MRVELLRTGILTPLAEGGEDMRLGEGEREEQDGDHNRTPRLRYIETVAAALDRKIRTPTSPLLPSKK